MDDFSASGGDTSGGETQSEQVVKIESVLECILRSSFRSQSETVVVESLTRLTSSSKDSILFFGLVLRMLESGHRSIRLRNRMIMYQVLSRVCSSWDPVVFESLDQIKSLVLKIVVDVQKLSLGDIFISNQTLKSLSSLIARISPSSLMIDTLLSVDFIGGKPSASVHLVEESLIEFFADKITRDHLKLKSGQIGQECLSNFSHKYELIISIIEAVHRCDLVDLCKNTTAWASLYHAIYEHLDSSFEPLPVLLYLRTVVNDSDPPHLSEHIFQLSDRKEEFSNLIEIIWRYDMASVVDQNQVVERMIEYSSWEIFGELKGENGKKVIEILISRIPNTSQIYEIFKHIKHPSIAHYILHYVESVVSEDDSQQITFRTVDELVTLIDLIGEVVKQENVLLLSFLIKHICCPPSIIEKKVEKSALVGDLVPIVRDRARKKLIEICSTIRTIDILNTLVECIEHMPSFGVSTICHCITLQVHHQEISRSYPSFPPSQGIIVLVWLLIFLQSSNDDEIKESIISCLVAISGLVHPSLSEIWEERVDRLIAVAENEESVGDEFEWIIEFVGHAEDSFHQHCRETISMLLESANLIDSKHLLVDCYSCVMKSIDDLLSFKSIIARCPLCIRSAAKAIGKRGKTLVNRILELVETTESISSSMGCCRSSTIANEIRLINNKSSFRGLFVTNRSEQTIAENLALKQTALLSIGYLSATLGPYCADIEMETRDMVMVLLSEIRSDRDDIKKNNLKGINSASSTCSSAIESIGKIAAVSLNPAYPVRFKEEAITILLDILDADCFVEPSLLCLSQLLVVCEEISSNVFSRVLETTLHCLVKSVPDTFTTELEVVRVRCQLSALVVKGLFSHHANTWLGFNRLMTAVFSLGVNGPVPLVRWVCLGIVNVLIDETGAISTDNEMIEFCEIFATLVPRLGDDHVKAEALNISKKLLERCNFPVSDDVVTTVCISIADKYLVGYLVNLIRNVNDSDIKASRNCLDAIHQVLSIRNVPINDDDSIVNLILNQQTPDQDTRNRLLDSLRYIAAIRFPVTIKKILDDGPLTEDKIFTIKSLAKEKTTLQLLTQELMNRMNRDDETSRKTASESLGYVLDCYEDKGVELIVAKYYCEMYVSLLMDLDSTKPVLHKLQRAVGGCRIPDSVTVETGLSYLEIPDRDAKVFQYLKPFIRTSKSEVCIILMSQFERINTFTPDLWACLIERGLTSENPRIKRYAIRSLGKQAFETIEASKLVDAVTTVVREISSPNSDIAKESLKALKKLLHSNQASSDAIICSCLKQLRRVVDHSEVSVRKSSLDLLAMICETKPIDTEQSIGVISDLWIPCLLRTEESDSNVRSSARSAFKAILKNVMDLEEPDTSNFGSMLDIVGSEFPECSKKHLGICLYYLQGLSSTESSVIRAVARLVPVVYKLIPGREVDEVLNEICNRLIQLKIVQGLTDIVTLAHKKDEILVN